MFGGPIINWVGLLIIVKATCIGVKHLLTVAQGTREYS